MRKLNYIGVILMMAHFLACTGNKYEEEIEQAKYYLDEATFDGDDKTNLIEYSTMARELLEPRFDETTGALTAEVLEQTDDLQREYLLLYSESILGYWGISFINIFVDFLTQESTGSEFQLFDAMIPVEITGDHIDLAKADFSFGSSMLTTNTQTSLSLNALHPKSLISRTSDTDFVQIFMNFATFSLVSRKFDQQGSDSLTEDDTQDFIDSLVQSTDALDSLGLDEEVTATLKNAVDEIAASGGDVDQAVKDFLSEQYASEDAQ